MPIEDVIQAKGRGTAIVGPVEHGNLLQGQAVEVIGLQEGSFRFTANDLSKPGMGSFTGLAMLETGDYGGILVPSQYEDILQRGRVAITPGSITVHNLFKASLYLLRTDEGGRDKPIELVIGYAATHWFRPQICPYDTAYLHYDCAVEHPEPQSVPWFELNPGEESEVIIRPWLLIPIRADQHFRLFQARQMIGRGIVTQVLSNV
jgi:elongation factor Tu